MSVEWKAYLGYTVNVKNNISNEDFEIYDAFLNEHPEYNRYDAENRVSLVVDGMNGQYARLIFALKTFDDAWEGDYYKIYGQTAFEPVYSQLTEAYHLLTGNLLDPTAVELALWFNYS